jgi:hypothetical protein
MNGRIKTKWDLQIAGYAANRSIQAIANWMKNGTQTERKTKGDSKLRTNARYAAGQVNDQKYIGSAGWKRNIEANATKMTAGVYQSSKASLKRINSLAVEILNLNCTVSK